MVWAFPDLDVTGNTSIYLHFEPNGVTTSTLKASYGFLVLGLTRTLGPTDHDDRDQKDQRSSEFFTIRHDNPHGESQ